MLGETESTGRIVTGNREPLIGNALLDRLGHHRHLLLALFLLLEGALFTLVLLGGTISFGEVFHAVAGNQPSTDWSLSLEDYDPRQFVMIGVCLALQGALMLGIGTIRLGKLTVPTWRRIVFVVAFAVIASIGFVGFFFSALEFGDRAGADGSYRAALFRVANSLSSAGLLWVLLTSWILWLIIGLLLMRNVDHPRGVGRVFVVLIGSSWIEFLLSLPIDLGARPQNEGCPCSTGSYLSLVLAVPALVCAMGPAVLLLYQRERLLNLTDPGRARRVLRAKSQRGGQA